MVSAAPGPFRPARPAFAGISHYQRADQSAGRSFRFGNYRKKLDAVYRDKDYLPKRNEVDFEEWRARMRPIMPQNKRVGTARASAGFRVRRRGNVQDREMISQPALAIAIRCSAHLESIDVRIFCLFIVMAESP